MGGSRKQGIELGKEAKVATAETLGNPFTRQTRWRAVFGPSRYYAFVYTADGSDLAQLLVRHGLARIYGTRAPAGEDSRQYLTRLDRLEQLAKSESRGGWRR